MHTDIISTISKNSLKTIPNSKPALICSDLNFPMKKLKTQKRLLERKRTSYRKAAFMKLENLVTESGEADRKDYQEN